MRLLRCWLVLVVLLVAIPAGAIDHAAEIERLKPEAAAGDAPPSTVGSLYADGKGLGEARRAASSWPPTRAITEAQ